LTNFYGILDFDDIKGDRKLVNFDAYLDIETSEGAKPTIRGRRWLCYWNIIIRGRMCWI